MKKQYNYYMDTSCKEMIEYIRSKESMHISMLTDSQIVEYLIRQRAKFLGYEPNQD